MHKVSLDKVKTFMDILIFLKYSLLNAFATSTGKKYFRYNIYMYEINFQYIKKLLAFRKSIHFMQKRIS